MNEKARWIPEDFQYSVPPLDQQPSQSTHSPHFAKIRNKFIFPASRRRRLTMDLGGCRTDDRLVCADDDDLVCVAETVQKK